MSARVKLGAQDSFLNRLLVLREQEVLNLSKKLHHQVALDSDGGSGVSEGSLGSPEPSSVSPPPPSSPHPRLHSPSINTKPVFLPTIQRLHYDDYRNDDTHELQHYDHRDPYNHHHHSGNYLHYDQAKDQLDQNHPAYDSQHHDLPFSRGSDDHNDDSWYSSDRQDDRHQEVKEEQQQHLQQQHQEGPEYIGDAADNVEGRKMEMSVLHETLQHQQQMALAARALLGTLASPEVPPPLLSFSHRLQPEKVGGSTSLMVRALASTTPRRPRGEKKPIPETLKDDKYYERRKRNNLAAKKSRDARKQREDQVAIRASILEKENAILRAQVATLRDEAASLRQLLFQKKTRRQ